MWQRRAIVAPLLLAAAEAPAEAVDLPVGVELAQLTGPERVAVGGDLEPHYRDLLAVDLALLVRGESRARDPLVARRRVDEEHLVVVRVDLLLHGAYQLALRTPGSCPRSARSRSAMREIPNFR